MRVLYTYVPYLSSQDFERSFFDGISVPEGSSPWLVAEEQCALSGCRVPSSSKVPGWQFVTWQPL